MVQVCYVPVELLLGMKEPEVEEESSAEEESEEESKEPKVGLIVDHENKAMSSLCFSLHRY